MSKLITTAERIEKANSMMEEARSIPVPPSTGWQDFTYVAKVKDILRQAKDMIKLIPVTASATAEQKIIARDLLAKLPQLEKEILHRD